MNSQNAGGSMLKYSDAYFNGDINASVFSLLAVIAIMGITTGSDELTNKIFSLTEEIFAKKERALECEETIKKELYDIYSLSKKGRDWISKIPDTTKKITAILKQ